MKLNTKIVCAEFLTHFLTIIQNEQERNAATLGSGFLRANQVANALVKIAADNSFIPLSAVVKAGLVSAKKDKFLSPNTDLAMRVNFYCDLSRTQAQLKKLHVSLDLWSEIQQLVFVTCFQESMNRVHQADIFISAHNLSGREQDEVVYLMSHCGMMALSSISSTLRFIPGENALDSESISLIEQQRSVFFDEAKTSEERTISDNFLIGKHTLPQADTLSLTERILLLDELLPTLAQDPRSLHPQDRLERSAKLHVLRLYSTILSITMKDAWQVKAQWLQTGAQVQIGQKKRTLPYSVSTIITIIRTALAQKKEVDYCHTLEAVQKIAQQHQESWYTWGRNQVPLICSSEAVTRLLAEIVDLKLDGGASLLSRREEEKRSWFSFVTNEIRLPFFSGSTLVRTEQTPQDIEEYLSTERNYGSI